MGHHRPGPYFDEPGPWTWSMKGVHGPGVHVLYFPLVTSLLCFSLIFHAVEWQLIFFLKSSFIITVEITLPYCVVTENIHTPHRGFSIPRSFTVLLHPLEFPWFFYLGPPNPNTLFIFQARLFLMNKHEIRSSLHT